MSRISRIVKILLKRFDRIFFSSFSDFGRRVTVDGSRQRVSSGCLFGDIADIVLASQIYIIFVGERMTT